MVALARFTFCGFTLRPAGMKDDRKLAAEWTAADRFHRLTTRADFWLEQEPGTESYLLEDKVGPVFFFKMVRTGKTEVEVHIQFPPRPADHAASQAQRARVVQGLILGFEWLERVLLLTGVRTVFFVSKSPSLIAFTIKRMGFVRESGKLFKTLTPPMAGRNYGEES